ncbi:hypothetical protein BD410DRAFT_896303 [Rickenella mellea]|uniref:ZZ-type domain-containing protein n=1 Tax=Rickenella mellea TaxID=50990 RepID=A0A4Y7QDM2_9AGAM|nr:hypothetical protein BD410DRAFT_896303 [Rickenella mellea]
MSKDASLKPEDAARGVDNFSKAMDCIHDNVATADGTVTLAISTAQKAMAGVSMADVMSMTPRECLIPLKRVMDALNAVKGVHPFVGLAVTAFEVLLTLEMKRRENDKRVSGVLLKQGDMMTALLQLDDIKDVYMKNEKGETVAGRLQTLIAEIRKDIMACGNIIDTYYKQKFVAKFLRASSWEDKFMGLASTFDKRKEEIRFALEIHVTVKLDTVADQVTSIDVKMDMLIHLFKDQTPEEKKLSSEVERLGGIESCICCEGLVAQLDPDKTSRETMSTSLLASVRTPVDTLIEENKAYFDLKTRAQTKQIDTAIKRSTQKIIRTIGERPWRRILDPDIREVWKNMNAHSSVKARYFVLALHDYYLDRYEIIDANANVIFDPAPVDITIGRPPSPATSHTESEATNADADIIALPPPPEEDKWCLQFLSIQTVSPITAAIDEDVSGFIKIAEVNSFFNDKPKSFSMLRWVTFWAAGWAVEASIYHVRIEELIEKLLDIVVMPENTTSFAYYADTLLWILWLLRSQSHTTTESPELIDLVREHMRLQEETITEVLEPAKWEIDASDTVSTLLGPGRIEKFLYPVLYLVLRYHYQVFSLGVTHPLDNREFEAAWTTLWSILRICNDRTTTLAVFFQQRHGGEEFKTFANGLYNNWHTSNPYKKWFGGNDHPDLVPPFKLPDGEYEMDDPTANMPELDVEKLHYGFIDAAGHLDETAEHRAFIELMKKQLGLQYAGEPLSAEDTEKMVEFECTLESVLEICKTIAVCEFNKAGVHRWVCDGCGMYPILGTHYQCLGCCIDAKKLDFDLCQNCVVQLPEKPARDCSLHKSSHPMNRFPYCTGKAIRIRSREKAVEVARQMAKQPITAFSCNGSCGKVDVHGLHFRCVQCEEFVLCADCVSNETKESAGHRSTHVLTRFTGEPLSFAEETEENEVSDRVRMAKMEAVLDKFDERLANQETLIKSLTDQVEKRLEKQERLMQSLVDASNREKGIAVIDTAPL